MIGFIGMSHLGLNTSAAVADHGFDVLCFDAKQELIDGLKETRLPVFEPGLEELFKKNKSRIQFTANPQDLQKCDLTYISLDVPTNSQNQSDLKAIEGLLFEYKNYLKKGSTLVILSQVNPGFTRPIHREFQKIGVHVYYQVETLIFGIAVQRAQFPERYIVGCAEPQEKLPDLFQKLLSSFNCPILPMRFESAELTKIAINFYLTSQVSVTNTLAEICERVRADWREITPALRLDKRIGPHAYLSPGLGLAGGNLERDLRTILDISNSQGTESSIVSSWLLNSGYRKDWVYRELYTKVLTQIKKPQIAVWGLAYKVGTHSLKNAPSLQLLEKLSGFQVTCYDPHAKLPDAFQTEKCHQASSAKEAVQDADGLVVLTPYDEFRNYPLAQLKQQMRGAIIIDPFQVLPKNEGFQQSIMGIGV